MDRLCPPFPTQLSISHHTKPTKQSALPGLPRMDTPLAWPPRVCSLVQPLCDHRPALMLSLQGLPSPPAPLLQTHDTQEVSPCTATSPAPLALHHRQGCRQIQTPGHTTEMSLLLR